MIIRSYLLSINCISPFYIHFFRFHQKYKKQMQCQFVNTFKLVVCSSLSDMIYMNSNSIDYHYSFSL